MRSQISRVVLGSSAILVLGALAVTILTSQPTSVAQSPSTTATTTAPLSPASKLDSYVRDFRLRLISDAKVPDPIRLHPGDILQLAPFAHGSTREFLGASLGVSFKGDRSLESVGQTKDVAIGDEGQARPSVFIYARQPGRTTVNVELSTGHAQPSPSYKASYDVIVEKD